MVSACSRAQSGSACACKSGREASHPLSIRQLDHLFIAMNVLRKYHAPVAGLEKHEDAVCDQACRNNR